jgi:ribonuclease BN (tRNA processing enzyme)
VSAELQFVGVGEAIDPARPNTATLYRGTQTLLVDCGYAIPHAFWAIESDPDALDGVYLTHTHADHAFGLPALLLWMRMGGRERPLKIIGGPGVREWVERALELGYPGSFAPHKCFAIEHVELRPDSPLRWRSLRLTNARTGHGVPNHALRLEAEGHGPVCFSGDGAPTPAVTALYHRAAVLVQECYWAETPAPKLAAKHADLPRVRALVDAAQVERAYLVHFGADVSDEVERAIVTLDDPRLRVARQGARVSLESPIGG